MRAQVPYLKLDCPKDGSLTQLCFSFFFEIDRLLGTNFFDAYVRRKGVNLDLMQLYMSFVCGLIQLGVLVIDEIQNLNWARCGGSDVVLNFFVRLSNVIGVPVIMIGTYHAFGILTNEFRQIRREIH